MRLRLINNSKSPQRLHILPPMTPFFKIRYNKKGMVPAGISEDIFIKFTPSEHKYYYDCIRIHCEGEKLLVPIHGFPVINNEKDLLLPSLIDMGKLKTGGTKTKTLTIDCTTPVTFEYEIKWIK